MCGQIENWFWTQDHLTRLPCYVKLTSFPYTSISQFFTLQWSIEHPLYGRHYPRHWVNSGEKINKTSAFEGASLPVASLTHQWNVWPKIRTMKKKQQGSVGDSAWHQAGGIGRVERKELSILSTFITEKARTEWWKIFLRARKSQCEASMGWGGRRAEADVGAAHWAMVSRRWPALARPGELAFILHAMGNHWRDLHKGAIDTDC